MNQSEIYLKLALTRHVTGMAAVCHLVGVENAR